MQNRPISTFEGQARLSQRAERKPLPHERRAAVRYGVRLRVELSWIDGGGSPRKSEGFTKNLSPKGAYVIAMECPPHDAKIQINFQLPPDASGSKHLWLEAQGSILRIESASEASEKRGFAVQLWRARTQAR